MFQKIKSFLFENKGVKQTVAKNTFWLTVTNFGGRFLKAVIIIYAARVLGTVGYGVFSYAITLAGFFTLFIDPGVNAIVMREIPKETSEEGRMRILGTTFVMKLFLVAAAVLVIIFVAPTFSTLPGAKELLPIVAFIIAFDTIREFFSAFIRANEKMEWETGIFMLTNATIVIAGFIALSLADTPLALGWAYAFGTVIGAVTAAVVLKDYLKRIFRSFSSALIMPIITSAWPFAVTGVLGILLTNTDILIISWMRSASEVGIYSAAIRIVQFLYLVPAILQFSTLPILSRFANTENGKFRGALERTIGLIFLASIPLALGGAILGTQIIWLVFGSAYIAGSLAFKILMLTMIVDYPAAIISIAIFAYNRQRSLIIAAAIGGVMNVTLDLILIPPYGIAGSAFGTLVTQIVVNWYLWRVMKKINYFEVVPKLKKVAVAGVVMAAATATFFFLGLSVIPNIILSAAVYFLALRVLREPLLIEIKNALAPRSSAADSAL